MAEVHQESRQAGAVVGVGHRGNPLVVEVAGCTGKAARRGRWRGRPTRNPPGGGGGGGGAPGKPPGGGGGGGGIADKPPGWPSAGGGVAAEEEEELPRFVNQCAEVVVVGEVIGQMGLLGYLRAKGAEGGWGCSR